MREIRRQREKRQRIKRRDRGER
jgi:hypothetical protein